MLQSHLYNAAVACNEERNTTVQVTFHYVTKQNGLVLIMVHWFAPGEAGRWGSLSLLMLAVEDKEHLFYHWSNTE